MADNRKQFRFLIPGSIVMQTVENEPHIRKGLVVDFGRKGVGIHSDVYIDKGMVVKFLILNKEYDFKLKGTGRVTNIRFVRGKQKVMYRIGLEFEQVNAGELAAIIEQINAMGW